MYGRTYSKGFVVASTEESGGARRLHDLESVHYSDMTSQIRHVLQRLDIPHLTERERERERERVCERERERESVRERVCV